MKIERIALEEIIRMIREIEKELHRLNLEIRSIREELDLIKAKLLNKRRQ